MQKKHGKYIHLDQFSTSQLEEILRMDLESSEDCDTDVIFQILEVIEQRENDSPAKASSDTEKAWAEFQQYYNIPEGEGRSLYSCGQTSGGQDSSESVPIRKSFKPYRWLKQGAVAAVAVLFGGLIAAQAAGIDVFGTIERWTNDTFHFASLQNDTITQEDLKNIEYCQTIKDALALCGITGALAPTWYPPEFELAEKQILDDETSIKAHVSFSTPSKQYFSLIITRYYSLSTLKVLSAEKDSTIVEEYASGSKTFYILSNEDTTTAIWSEGLLMEQVSGNLTVDNIKTIIDSIGGK